MVADTPGVAIPRPKTVAATEIPFTINWDALTEDQICAILHQASANLVKRTARNVLKGTRHYD